MVKMTKGRKRPEQRRNSSVTEMSKFSLQFLNVNFCVMQEKRGAIKVTKKEKALLASCYHYHQTLSLQ